MAYPPEVKHSTEGIKWAALKLEKTLGHTLPARTDTGGDVGSSWLVVGGQRFRQRNHSGSRRDKFNAVTRVVTGAILRMKARWTTFAWLGALIASAMDSTESRLVKGLQTHRPAHEKLFAEMAMITLLAILLVPTTCSPAWTHTHRVAAVTLLTRGDSGNPH